jgi:hypothetical protein
VRLKLLFCFLNVESPDLKFKLEFVFGSELFSLHRIRNQTLGNKSKEFCVSKVTFIYVVGPHCIEIDIVY